VLAPIEQCGVAAVRADLVRVLQPAPSRQVDCATVFIFLQNFATPIATLDAEFPCLAATRDGARDPVPVQSVMHFSLCASDESPTNAVGAVPRSPQRCSKPRPRPHPVEGWSTKSAVMHHFASMEDANATVRCQQKVQRGAMYRGVAMSAASLAATAAAATEPPNLSFPHVTLISFIHAHHTRMFGCSFALVTAPSENGSFPLFLYCPAPSK
jgi:hypothetical protein